MKVEVGRESGGGGGSDGGGRPSGFDSDSRFVCINNNDNVVTEGNECPRESDEIESCFRQGLNEISFDKFLMALEDPTGITVEINGEEVTLRSFEDICEALEGLTFAQLKETITNILLEVDIILLTSGLAFCLAEIIGIPVPPTLVH